MISLSPFRQILYSVSKNDIYDGQARAAYKTNYQGMDGLGGTACSGTRYYVKKKTLFCSRNQQDEFLQESEKKFGFSKMLIDSVQELNKKNVYKRENISEATVLEAKKLASCTYEQNTRWGKEIDYSYDCLLESSFIGYLLHCKGWKSIYLYPERPCFLGCTTIDMKGSLVQVMKWASGLVQFGLSRFCLSIMEYPGCLSFTACATDTLCFCTLRPLPCLLYNIVLPLSFLYGIALYPKATDPWFAAFAVVLASSFAQHLFDVISSGGSMTTVRNEQRIWMIRSVKTSLFGCMDVLMKYIGMVKANFRLTNKAIDQEKLEKYKKGKFNFQGAKMFMIPLTILVLLNLGCFIGSAKAVITRRNVAKMFGQGPLSLYVVVLSLPVLEGLVPKIRK